MKTRISKIARLPYETREELNLRLLNGELGAPLLQWLNELPTTKTLLNDMFGGRLITKQNLSEWRHAGYEDWLRHRHRQERFRQMSEQGEKLAVDENGDDPFENFARIVLAEMTDDLNDLHKLRNRNARWQRLHEIARNLARLQHGYNHSRKVDLSWLKWKVETGYDDQPPASNHPEQKPPRQLPSSIGETATVKPGPTESNQKNSSIQSPVRTIHHRKCCRGCVCQECHPEDGNYPYTQAVKDYEETRKPEYWALENIRPFILRHANCDCCCLECTARENRRTDILQVATSMST